MIRNSLATLGLAAVISFLPLPALAYQNGDIILRAGLAKVGPNDDSQALPAIANSSVGVNNDTQIGLTLTYMLNDSLGLGVLAATPFRHDIVGSDSITNLGTVAETRQLPPTVTLQYHFKTSNRNFHPFVGAGINYTNFFSEKTRGSLGASKISLDSSWGLALEAGFDYEFGNGWSAGAQLYYIDIDTDATITGGMFANPQKFKVYIDPWVSMVSVGKRF